MTERMLVDFVVGIMHFSCHDEKLRHLVNHLFHFPESTPSALLNLTPVSTGLQELQHDGNVRRGMPSTHNLRQAVLQDHRQPQRVVQSGK